MSDLYFLRKLIIYITIFENEVAVKNSTSIACVLFLKEVFQIRLNLNEMSSVSHYLSYIYSFFNRIKVKL